MEGGEAFSAAGVRGVPAVPLKVAYVSSGSGVVMRGEVKGGGAGEGSDLVQPDSAEAQHRVTRGVRLGDPDVAGEQGGLQRVDALLRVVGPHGKLRKRG